MARGAKSLETLRKQLNEIYPKRSKLSDGGEGDARHKKLKSDHNPNASGVFTARDFTHDPEKGIDCQKLANVLVAAKDSRIKYIIWNGRITSDIKNGIWKAYHGSNKHNHHLHISVNSLPKFYDDGSLWNLSALNRLIKPTISTAPPVFPAAADTAEGEGFTPPLPEPSADNTDWQEGVDPDKSSVETLSKQTTKEETPTGSTETVVQKNSFQSETKTMNLPESDGSTKAATGMTVGGILVPGFVVTLFSFIGGLWNQGMIDGKAVIDLVVRFFSENTRYIIYLVMFFVGFLALKKVMKSITFITQMIINAIPWLHDIKFAAPGQPIATATEKPAEEPAKILEN